MKKFLLITISFFIEGIIFSTPILADTPTPTPTPKIEPVEVTDDACPPDGTVYPPNSKCYAQVNKVETLGANLVDSNEGFLSYPLTCITAPTVTYKETYTTDTPLPSPLPTPIYKNVSVSTDITNAQFGFLGPDSNTLATSNPDRLAQKYLFNALFDRPGTDPNAQRESFRTFWRMLDSLSQAQLKAYYIQNFDKHVYFYVDKNYEQKEVKISELKTLLPDCLKNFGIVADILSCWKNDKYLDQYIQLGIDYPEARDAYDALLPFDFNNSRSYLSNEQISSGISEENIPYLQAVLSGLKGYRNDFLGIPNVVVPGLFDYYTPESARKNLALYPILPSYELLSLQYPLIKAVSILNKNNCSVPAKSSSLSSPKTFPNNPITYQTIGVPVAPVLIDSKPSECICDPESTYCYFGRQYLPVLCTRYSNNETLCVEKQDQFGNPGCMFFKGEYTYELTGDATGIPTTVFNNPKITSLTDLVIGGKPLISNTSDNEIIKLINLISDKLISPVQPSFYKMLLPDFASDSASSKSLVSASGVNTTTDNPNAAVSGGNTIYRENNLAQDTMHLLQNCWFVPSNQQFSSKCGSKITGGTCDGKKFKEILGDSVTPPSSAATSYFNTYISKNLTPEVISAYAAAEKATGIPCEVLAGIHFRENENNPTSNLQDGTPLSGITLEESAIQAGNDIVAKAIVPITDIDILIKAISRYNGGGNSNCQTSTSCPAASTLGACVTNGSFTQYCCGTTVACSSNADLCACRNPYEVGSCRASCGVGAFPWPIPYSACTPHPKEGFDDPYAINKWISPENDNMYILYQYDCTQTKPVPDVRPGAFTVALSLYYANNPSP